MMKSRFATLASLMAAACAVLLMTGCGDQKTVATVNGEKITKGELDAKLEQQGGKNTLAGMVQQDLIFQYAKEHNITATDAEVNDKLTEIESHFPPGQFDTMLKSQGISMDDARKLVRQNILTTKAVDQNITVTDAQVNDYLKQQHLVLGQPAQVQARHILVKSKAQAEMIEAQLKKGADFATLAKQYSIDPGTKDKGGDLGWFGPGQMVPAFQNAAFALKPGQISAPVQTPFGWHVIQVEGVKPLTKEAVIDQIKKQQESLQIQPFMNQLRASAKIEVEDPRYQDLFPSPAPVAPATAAPAPAPATPNK
ncbi:MAG TPA: peptidylprolyl isomerase [Candidatus Eremiobacteraceae bacterium]|nr:peptidylprolyl isomerase [Candidatus Eremiobacteraceae bacterium]